MKRPCQKVKLGWEGERAGESGRERERAGERTREEEGAGEEAGGRMVGGWEGGGERERRWRGVWGGFGKHMPAGRHTFVTLAIIQARSREP
jgi:hypothetical protein